MFAKEAARNMTWQTVFNACITLSLYVLLESLSVYHKKP